MYAVIETGGKQYRVQPGEVFQVEKLEGEVGQSLTFSNVLLTSKASGETAQITLGKPYLSGAAVQAEIVGQGRGEKILIVKMKRRKQYRRTQGHRQFYTQLLCTSLNNGAGETMNLSAEDKTARLKKFQSHLKEKGPAMTAPILGSRKRLAAARATGETPSTAKKSASAPKAAKAETSAAPKTAAAASKKKTTKTSPKTG